MPDIRIISFGAEEGFVLGGRPVTLLCVIKNMGEIPLSEKTLRVRCFALSGLDYTSGDTRPMVPLLAPKQSVAFRWRLGVREAKGAVVAGALLEATGTLPPNAPLPGNRSVVATIPRYAKLPAGSLYAPEPTDPPKADADGFLGNDRICLWFANSDRQQPLLILKAREDKVWRTLGTALPLVEVQSGEEGQQPWWEGFRWRSNAVSGGDKDTAALTLTGTLGTRWKASLTFEAKRDTAAIEATLRLIPIRQVRLYGVRLPTLLSDSAKPDAQSKADGSPISIIFNEPVLPEKSPVVANRTEGITYGMSWTESAPFPNGSWEPSPLANATLFPLLGAQWTAPTGGLVIQPGATVEIPFRIFALSASESVKDALRFVK